jgi:hypothetical protein
MQTYFDPERLAEAESRRRIFDFVIPRGTTPEQLLEPERWTKLAQHLKPWDRIELRSDDASFFGEALVRDIDAKGVHLAMLYGFSVDRVGAIGSAKRSANGERIEHRGEFERWCVLRGDKIISSKHPTEAQAAAWLGSHLATQARGAA